MDGAAVPPHDGRRAEVPALLVAPLLVDRLAGLPHVACPAETAVAVRALVRAHLTANRTTPRRATRVRRIKWDLRIIGARSAGLWERHCQNSAKAGL